MKTTCILQNIVRIIGIIQLISGIVVWTGNGEALVIGHIVLGYILTLALAASLSFLFFLHTWNFLGYRL